MKRGTLDLICDYILVLDHEEPIVKTNVMYKMMIGWRTFKRIHNYLVKQNVVEERKEGVVLTQKGKELAKYFGEIKNIMNGSR